MTEASGDPEDCLTGEESLHLDRRIEAGARAEVLRPHLCEPRRQERSFRAEAIEHTESRPVGMQPHDRVFIRQINPHAGTMTRDLKSTPDERPRTFLEFLTRPHTRRGIRATWLVRGAHPGTIVARGRHPM